MLCLLAPCVKAGAWGGWRSGTGCRGMATSGWRALLAVQRMAEAGDVRRQVCDVGVAERSGEWRRAGAGRLT
jgi:hypothetical protein